MVWRTLVSACMWVLLTSIAGRLERHMVQESKCISVFCLSRWCMYKSRPKGFPKCRQFAIYYITTGINGIYHISASQKKHDVQTKNPTFARGNHRPSQTWISKAWPQTSNPILRFVARGRSPSNAVITMILSLSIGWVVAGGTSDYWLFIIIP